MAEVAIYKVLKDSSHDRQGRELLLAVYYIMHGIRHIPHAIIMIRKQIRQVCIRAGVGHVPWDVGQNATILQLLE
jgi:hypothetical protein